jgi:hypothetical protein
MTQCENPACDAVLDPERVRRYNAKTCDAACRAAAFRARHGIVPVGGRAEAQTPVRTARRGRYKPPGPQLSYHRAVAALAADLARARWGLAQWGLEPPDAFRTEAERILRPVLPAAQRARLEAREK